MFAPPATETYPLKFELNYPLKIKKNKNYLHVLRPHIILKIDNSLYILSISLTIISFNKQMLNNYYLKKIKLKIKIKIKTLFRILYNYVQTF